MTVAEVMHAVDEAGGDLVEVTGGEPLLQRDAIALLEALVTSGRDVLLETGGHLPVDDVPDEVVTILDVKCPGSGEAGKMHWPNLDQLSSRDEVKFVVADRTDADYAFDVIRRHDLAKRTAAVLVSPVHGALDPAELARWILDTRLPVRLQLQAHKYIWSPETRGV
jgi:7-carboxy-7-deazaguanine synthase